MANTVVVQFRITKEQRDSWEKVATSEGKTLSDWCRAQCMAEAASRKSIGWDEYGKLRTESPAPDGPSNPGPDEVAETHVPAVVRVAKTKPPKAAEAPRPIEAPLVVPPAVDLPQPKAYRSEFERVLDEVLPQRDIPGIGSLTGRSVYRSQKKAEK